RNALRDRVLPIRINCPYGSWAGVVYIPHAPAYHTSVIPRACLKGTPAMSPPPTQATLLDGKALAKTLQNQLAADIAIFKADPGVTPGLTAVRLGEDPASVVYVNKKAYTATALGIPSQLKIFPENTPQPDLLTTIPALNSDPTAHAV